MCVPFLSFPTTNYKRREIDISLSISPLIHVTTREDDTDASAQGSMAITVPRGFRASKREVPRNAIPARNKKVSSPVKHDLFRVCNEDWHRACHKE